MRFLQGTSNNGTFPIGLPYFKGVVWVAGGLTIRGSLKFPLTMGPGPGKVDWPGWLFSLNILTKSSTCSKILPQV